MPTESIVFGPNVPDRELDKEIGKIQAALDDLDETITPEVDESGLDGVGTGVSAGRAGGGGMGGVGGTAGAAGLASKLPKSVSGVAFGSVLPVALGGAIGAGMLSAMRSSSARLQTSETILSQAWASVWRPLGDDLDQLFVRDVAMEIRDATRTFEETYRNDERLEALVGLADDLKIDEFLQQSGGAAGTAGLGIDIVDMLFDFDITADDVVSEFSWPSLSAGDIVGSVGWPTVTAGVLLNPVTWPAVGAGLLLSQPDWPTISAGGIIGRIGWPSLTAEDVLGALTGDGGGDGTTTTTDSTPDGRQPGSTRTTYTSPSTGPDLSGGGFTDTTSTGFQRGGLVRGETTARVGEAGPEAVLPVSELERMMQGVARSAARVGQQGGGGGDVGGVEDRLDRLIRKVDRLAQAMQDMSVQVGREEFGRLASDTRRNHVSDSDPTV